MTATPVSTTLVVCILIFIMLYPRENTFAVVGRSLPLRIAKAPSSKTVIEVVGTSSSNRVYESPVVRSCKPKGFWPPPSAPSRYANYNLLGGHLLCDGEADNKH